MAVLLMIPWLLMIAIPGLIALLLYLSLFMPIPLVRPAPEQEYPMRTPAPAPIPERELTYTFNVDGILHEAAEENETRSPYWWLNSGGKLIIEDGVGKTVQGELSLFDQWRLNYGLHNPEDSDGGSRPQNIFRLISRSAWEEPRITATFRIVKDNLSGSRNRNETNGIFLMSRYVDSETLYYAGVRADGHAVIKKKHRGTYYTLAERAFFPGVYDRDHAANLIPHSEWMELTSETSDEDGAVVIRLYVKRHGADEPSFILEAVDDGRATGNPPISGEAKMGIRTDFMDVEFRRISIEEI